MLIVPRPKAALLQTVTLQKAKFKRKIGAGKHARYIYEDPKGKQRSSIKDLQATLKQAIIDGKGADEIAPWTPIKKFLESKIATVQLTKAPKNVGASHVLKIGPLGEERSIPITIKDGKVGANFAYGLIKKYSQK